jgi:hypothetical protein
MKDKTHEALLKELEGMNSRFTIQYKQDHNNQKMSIFPKRKEPVYSTILANCKKHYGDKGAVHQIAADDYAKAYLEYHRPKLILLIKGRMEIETFEALVKYFEADYYVISLYFKQPLPTYEIICEGDLDKHLTKEEQKELSKHINKKLEDAKV